MNKFNREILALARESRGYTQSELSILLNVEQGTISKIENGNSDISFDMENLIPSVLDYPKDLFYSDKKVIRVEGHYRKKISLPVKELKKYRGVMTFVEWNINKLSDGVNFPNPNIPSWDLETDGSAEDAARYVRQYWKIPRGRINDLATILEDNGIIIAPLELENMDGLSTYSAEYNLPILYVNKLRSSDRMRFNLAHELAHYVCHFGKKIANDREDRNIESEANDFASELLMPTVEIRPQLIGLTLQKLIDLKQYWKVSIAAIVYKAKKIGAISDSQYKYLWRQLTIAGYRVKEPGEFKGDNISMLKELIETYIDELNFSKEELAKMLDLTVDNLEVSYLGATPKRKFLLRLIK